MAPALGSGVWQRSCFQKLDFTEMKRSCCCCAAANSASFCFSSPEPFCFTIHGTHSVHKLLCTTGEIAWPKEHTESSAPPGY